MSTRLAETPDPEAAAAELASDAADYVAATKRSDRMRRLAVGRLPASFQAGSPAWTWAGVVVAAAGFILLAIAWGQVAAETQVYLQVPYVVSAALVGLGVVMVGLTMLNVASRQQDAAARDRKIDQLLSAIEELQEALAEPKRRRR